MNCESSKADRSLPLLNPMEVGSQTFADSDTEMEDDISHPDDDPGVKYSTEAPKSSPKLVPEELDEKESLAEQSASIRDCQLPIPVHSFPLSSSFLQVNTNSQTDMLYEESYADRSRKDSSSSDSAKPQDFSEFGGADMYDPFVDSLEPHPYSLKNLSYVQQHEPASDPFVERFEPHLNMSHVQQHETASDPFVESFEPQPNLSQQHESANDPFVDSHSLEGHPNLSHVQQQETASDPFVDSLKPRHLNLTHVQQHEPVSGFNVTAGLRALSNKPHDVEESNTGSDVGNIVPGTSMHNKESGENGNVEAEAGSIQTGSSDPLDESADPNSNNNKADSGRKSSREKKTNKDSRSMRLFKVVLTQFVKDCLKPSWRQGNMSKEAFKTIVKKTVDKVSGAMEGRRIPKSRAKIDRYIDSSQKKLTKLVMGYVDKYVKA